MRILPVILAISAVAAPADAATRNFGIASFDKVRVEGPYKITLSTEVAPFARASGSPAAIDRVAIEVRGNTLIVHNSLASWGGFPNANSGPVEIVLGTHDLRSVWLNGSGTIAIDKAKGLSFDLSIQGSGRGTIARVDVDQLHLNLGGSASVVLAGKAAKLTAVVRGVSSLDAAALRTKDAVLGAEGAATVTADVRNAIKIDGSGPATVTLSGKPACTLRVGGSASISGCGKTQ
ncbi:MAG: DUF2807 domain-containing protein [Sphingomicrobium sp.]